MSFLSLSTDPVTQAYPEDPIAITGDSTVGEVLQLMRAAKGSCALICTDGKLDGIFTERDALTWMAEGGSPDASIRKRMSPKPVTLDSKATVGHAIEVMSEGGYRHLPVVDGDGMPRGVLAVRGIVHYLVDHFPQTIYNLPPEPKRNYDREGA